MMSPLCLLMSLSSLLCLLHAQRLSSNPVIVPRFHHLLEHRFQSTSACTVFHWMSLFYFLFKKSSKSRCPWTQNVFMLLALGFVKKGCYCCYCVIPKFKWMYIKQCILKQHDYFIYWFSYFFPSLSKYHLICMTHHNARIMKWMNK